MVLEKKKRHSSTGRPLGSTGDTDLNNMNDDERREYFHVAKQRERSNADLADNSLPTTATLNTPSTPSGKSATRSGSVYSPSSSDITAEK